MVSLPMDPNIDSVHPRNAWKYLPRWEVPAFSQEPGYCIRFFYVLQRSERVMKNHPRRGESRTHLELTGPGFSIRSPRIQGIQGIQVRQGTPSALSSSVITWTKWVSQSSSSKSPQMPWRDVATFNVDLGQFVWRGEDMHDKIWIDMIHLWWLMMIGSFGVALFGLTTIFSMDSGRCRLPFFAQSPKWREPWHWPTSCFLQLARRTGATGDDPNGHPTTGTP